MSLRDVRAARARSWPHRVRAATITSQTRSTCSSVIGGNARTAAMMRARSSSESPEPARRTVAGGVERVPASRPTTVDRAAVFAPSRPARSALSGAPGSPLAVGPIPARPVRRRARGRAGRLRRITPRVGIRARLPGTDVHTGVLPRGVISDSPELRNFAVSGVVQSCPAQPMSNETRRSRSRHHAARSGSASS